MSTSVNLFIYRPPYWHSMKAYMLYKLDSFTCQTLYSCLFGDICTPFICKYMCISHINKSARNYLDIDTWHGRVSRRGPQSERVDW